MGKNFEIGQKRVVGFVGHASSGKTSICEAILYNTKNNDRLGSVDQGQSLMDYEEEEQKRKYSVLSSFFDVEYKNTKIYFVDTPGNSNFIPDSNTILPAIGSAIVPVDGVDGVKYQTEVMCDRLKEAGIPYACFITKLDKEHCDFDKALESIKNLLPVEPVVIQLPIGKEDSFTGVVDILAQKAYTYSDASGKGAAGDIPADLADQVETLRAETVERLVEGDDEVMMKYLEGEEVTDEELMDCLKKGTVSGQFCPVLCGSPTKNMGVDLLCDFIVKALPAPNEERPRLATKPGSEEEIEVPVSTDGPFAAQIVKTLSDPFAGKVSIFRIIRGVLKPDDAIYNVTRDSKEKAPGKLYAVRGKKQVPVDGAEAGDIVAVLKMKDLGTGDSLSDVEANGLLFPELPEMLPMLHYAVGPKSQGEEEKMTTGIQKSVEEDSNLHFWREDQTSQFILSGVGQAQIDVAMERMRRKYNVEVELTPPKVPYRETIKGKAEVQGKFKKQTGGRGQYGDCHIRVEPKPRGEGFEFVDSIVGGVIPRQFIPAVEKGVVEAMVRGELTGSPVQDVRVELFFGSFHTVDSSENAFKSAGRMAWRKAMLEANPVLLEPIHKITISVPSEYMGDVYGYISSHRGKVLGSEEKGKLTEIYAEVPQVEMGSFNADIRAMTGDRGSFVAKFEHYEEVPGPIAEKIIEEAAKAKEEG